MRKLILIVLLLAMQITNKAQSYYPLPDSNAVWTLFHYGQTGSEIQKFGISGDTIINSITYKKIYWCFDYNFNLANLYYKAAIRQINKKVYVVYPTHTSESILYDFTLTINDTAKVISQSGFLYSYKVASIDSINISGHYHKRWKFNSASFHDEEYWIEGIGSTFGLLLPLWTGSDNCFNLLCASKDSSVIYQYLDMPNMPTCTGNLPYDCDGLLNPASVREQFIENTKTIIFPNPFSNSAIIKTNNELYDATLKVYDILGQEMLMLAHLNGQEIKIIKDNLNSGNYYYHLTQNGSLVSKGKFIVE